MPRIKKNIGENIGEGVGGTFRTEHNFGSQGNINYVEWNIVQNGLGNKKKKTMTDINCTTKIV